MTALVARPTVSVGPIRLGGTRDECLRALGVAPTLSTGRVDHFEAPCVSVHYSRKLLVSSVRVHRRAADAGVALDGLDLLGEPAEEVLRRLKARWRCSFEEGNSYFRFDELELVLWRSTGAPTRTPPEADFVYFQMAELGAPGRFSRPDPGEVEELSPADVARLAGSGARLDLSRQPVGDASLAGLVGNTTLRELDLSDTAITDDGLASVGACSNLEVCGLDETSVSDRGLAHLRGLAGLRRLHLGMTQVRGPGVATLPAGLDYLGLSSTPLDASALGCLRRFTELRHLYLEHTRLDPSVVPTLGTLKQLAWLDLWECQGLGRADLRALRAALPGCKVSSDLDA